MTALVDDLWKSTVSIPMDIPDPFEFRKDTVLQVGGGCSAETNMKKYLELPGIPCHDEYSLLRALPPRHTRKVVDQIDQFVMTSG